MRRLPFQDKGSLPEVVGETRGYGPARWLNLGHLGWLAAHMHSYRPASLKPARENDAAISQIGPQNQYRSPALSFDEKQQIASRYLSERLKRLTEFRGQAVGLWKTYAIETQRQGGRVLFLGLPQSRAMAPVDQLAGPWFEVALRELRQAGALTVDWRHMEIPEQDFYDQQHLLAEGRRKVLSPFVRLLAAEIPGCGPRP